MIGKLLEMFMRNPMRGHEELFEFKQGVMAEKHLLECSKDVAAIGREKLELLAQVGEDMKRFEGGDELMDQAVSAYRDGMAALLGTPLHLYPKDREERLEAMARPSNGSTESPSSSAVEPTGPGRIKSSDAAPAEAQALAPPRRPRGRPKGSLNKPKPPRSLEEGRES